MAYWDSSKSPKSWRVQYHRPHRPRKRKICNRCGKRRLHYRAGPKPTARNPDGFATICIQCLKERYHSNPKVRKNIYLNRKQKYERNRLYIAEYLKTHPCINCGEDDPCTLDFDHVRGRKRKNVSRMVVDGYCIKTLQLEIDKCQVLCSNCHRKKTAHQLRHHKVRLPPGTSYATPPV